MLGVDIMINLRPTSDLRNNYLQIEDIVINKKEPVFLTKDGYGSVVVISLEEYTKLKGGAEEPVGDEIATLFGDISEQSKGNPRRYANREILSRTRSMVNGAKKL